MGLEAEAVGVGAAGAETEIVRHAAFFLGGFFAWLYARTRTILAPMTAHFVFNALNLVLLLFFPELAANS